MCPKITFVGTHKDLEHICTQENREIKEKRLRSIMPEEIEDSIVQLKGESILLTINAKTPSKMIISPIHVERKEYGRVT